LVLRPPEVPQGCDREKMSFCAKLNFNTDDDGGSIGYFTLGEKKNVFI